MRETHGGRRFRIELGGESIGFSLSVCDGDCCTHDFPQDTIARAHDDALAMCGLSPDTWTDDDETAEPPDATVSRASSWVIAGSWLTSQRSKT